MSNRCVLSHTLEALTCYTHPMLPLYYIRWHYTQGVLDLLNIVGNFLWFFNELFSIRMSVRTFFVPFHRLSDDARPHGALDIGNLLERFLVNVLMRLVGALLHLTLIVLGIIFLAATALASA